MSRPRPLDDATRSRMSKQRRRDTGPELALRRELHRRGLRYRVDTRPIAVSRCRADIVFAGQKVAVFVDGCFWHGCPDHATFPAHNRDWWAAKLAANALRDRRFDGQLTEAGWRPIRVWEHEDMTRAADRVEQAVIGDVTEHADKAEVMRMRNKR